MTAQLLRTAAQHPLSLIGLVDNAASRVREATFAAAWRYSPLARWAESAVVSVLQNIQKGTLTIRTPETTYTFPASSSNSNGISELNGVIIIRNPTFWLRLALMGDLGFAESYMFGEISINGDADGLVSIFMIFLANRSFLSSFSSSSILGKSLEAAMSIITARLSSSRFLNSVGNAAGNISAHYDISNEMFAAFLSKDMTYSCAVFETLDGDLHVQGVRATDVKAAFTKMTNVINHPDGLSNGKVNGATILTKTNGVNGRCTSPFESSSSGSTTPQSSSPNSYIESDETSLDKERGRDGYAYVDDELHAAQLRKLDLLISRAQIQPGMRVLELGCGWGSLALRIAQTIPGTQMECVTLSAEQRDFVDEMLDSISCKPDLSGTKESQNGQSDNLNSNLMDRIHVHLTDYRMLPKLFPHWQGKFDRVVSCEMLEAIGVEFYGAYWEVVDWALKKDTGVGVVQCITIPESRYERYVKEVDFIRKWIFPGGILPTFTLLVSSLGAATSGRLVVDSVDNIGPHYARTLREWRARFERNWAEVRKALGEKYPETMGSEAGERGDEEAEVFKRKWLYYFCYCEVGFTTRVLGDHVITFTREGNTTFDCKVIS